MVNDLLKCPFCPCSFVCVDDLVLHLQTFGLQGGLHSREFREVHEWLEREFERKHGGADKTVWRLAKVLLAERGKVVVSE